MPLYIQRIPEVALSFLKDDNYYLVIFNASGDRYNIEDIGNLKLVAGNSRQVSDSFVEDLTATVFEVVEW